MKKYFITAALFCFSSLVIAQADTSVIISEIMFNPTSGNNEFIEIYNTSETESIDINNYRLKYSTSTADVIIGVGFGTTLPPNSYAIVLEGDYDIVSGIYNNLIPPSALILKISDNSFGASGMANTADRPVWFINPVDDTLDVRTYSANNTTAISDEKIILNKDSTSSNWANSLNTNGTPGFRNSVALTNYDLRLSSINISPLIPVQGNDLQINAVVKNSGIQNADSYTIEIFNDTNFDSVAVPSELIFSKNYFNLVSGDSISASTSITNVLAGNYNIIAKILFAQDEDTTNNRLLKRITVFPPGNNYNDVVINEIMYSPSTGEPEWVEIYNRTTSTINLKKWTLSDLSSTVIITNSDKIILPNSFVVLSRDSSILNFYNVPVEIITFSLPTLNNTGDAVVIKDSIGIVLDSINFLSSWGGNTSGKSLERIDVNTATNQQANWGSSQSLSKATPGRVNSLTPKENDLSVSSFKPVTEFGILGEYIYFDLIVKNRGVITSPSYSVSFFNDVNADSIPQQSELLSTLNQLPLLSNDSITITYNTNSFIEGHNHFIALINVTPDDDSTNNIAFTKLIGVEVNELRNDLVINELMYAPNSPEPEWIEIYNRSNKIIDLKNYQLADNSDTVTINDNSFLINPGEFVVVATDISINNYYNIPSQVIVHTFPALNNSGDKLILLDSLSRVIDSLQYLSGWGGSAGKSLERISPEINSVDSLNWKTSTSRYKATPGYINSVTPKQFDVEAAEIISNPLFPLYGSDVSLTAKIKNNGSNNVVIDIQLFEDTNLDSIPDVLVETIQGVPINFKDSTVVPFSYSLSNIQMARGMFINVLFNSDQDTSNNYFYKTISPGYPPSTIVIDEIMYTPAGGEPEWIELFNTSPHSINLNDWSLSDVVTTPVMAKINSDVFIPSNGFLVVARDSSILNYHRLIPSKLVVINLPSFNNDADGVVLRDNRGSTIDSVRYSSDWGGTGGYSLERISVSINSNIQSNWGSSIDIEQSTPGRVNSITTKQNDLLISNVGFNPRFPVAGDDVFISATIKNNGTLPASNFITEFYIDTDSNNIPDLLLSSVTSSTLLQSDSISINSQSAISSIQSKILAAVRVVNMNDEDTLNNYVEKSVEPGFPQNSLLINEIMHSPSQGEPEWIEIVNASNDNFNIKNWSISDILTTPTKNIIIPFDYLISPNEYFVIAKDTSFYSYHNNINYKVFLVNFGTLSSSDGVMLYDFRDGIIDSVLYKSDWGGSNGYSIERLSFTKSGYDSSNWNTSLSPDKSTPGKVNSLNSIPSSARNDFVINEIMFDPDIDNCEFIEFINLSSDTINTGGWKIEDEKGNTNKLADISLLVPPSEYFILAADSSIIKKYSLQEHQSISIINETDLGLINTGELILLKDLHGNVIDSIWYSDKWHNRNYVNTKNRSLERINPDLNGNDNSNWSSSVSSSGATPGLRNSIFTNLSQREQKISVSPNPFSPDNDGYEDFTIINYNLTQITAQIRIKIFDSKGRLVRTLANNSGSGNSGSIIFDGLDDSGNALRIGIYIIYMEALNESSGVVETQKTTVVVARRLN
ncbi:MAG: lamin tail domain-containing protein [Ignavibacteriales bacterium]|nr:MAG: lamin tail domain-containing protein [Ignavibacteriales bacterium]